MAVSFLSISACTLKWYRFAAYSFDCRIVYIARKFLFFMEGLIVEVLRLAHAKDLALPRYQTELSAGVDVHAAIENELVLGAGEWKAVPTGLCVAIPPGYEAQVRPRSGLALKHGVSMVNTPGTIDADFRGEINIILINHGKNPFVVKRGERIAQIVFNKVETAQFVEKEKLSDTARGKGGFGSTGK